MRVLMGDFGAIVRIGLRSVLETPGVNLSMIETPNAEILAGLADALPDVVVLDLDRVDGTHLVGQITSNYPAIKVIACSADTPTMRVYPPFHNGESFELALNPTQLIHNVLH